MRNKSLLLILFVLFIAVAVWEGLPQRASNWLKSDRQWQNFLTKINAPESLPGPLQGPMDGGDSNSAQLTISGVISETNKQRDQYGQLPLRTNSKLNLAAKAKVDDMFRQQYFEHESPDGKKPADIIKAAGYEYLIVGENLALGNYENDQLLVEAWMNSPGHRANILDPKFREIGVAVGKGMYQGKEIWLAVQEFGSPLSSCPNISMTLKEQIDKNKAEISLGEQELARMKAEMESSNSKNSPEYQRKVEQYNSKVNSVNKLIDETKELVNQYNQQVNDFNSCLENNG
jgi:uncharacterized protein YkwD